MKVFIEVFKDFINWKLKMWQIIIIVVLTELLRKLEE